MAQQLETALVGEPKFNFYHQCCMAHNWQPHIIAALTEPMPSLGTFAFAQT